MEEIKGYMKFREKILATRQAPLHATGIEVLQVNLGYSCNMACYHCHVKAGPDRPEMMDSENICEVLRVLDTNGIGVLDITGGAPELNPWFKYLIEQARHIGCHVISRSNLTIFFGKGMEDLFDFYDRNNIELIASLPYYREAEVDAVRGTGTFRMSIEALRKLNGLGYGKTLEEKKLNLVYNPHGAFLPPLQSLIEEEYRKELMDNFGINFNSLYSFANMPVGRFREFLIRSEYYDGYMKGLHDAFNPQTLPGVMCRSQVNVSWDGVLYDCDFNQMLGCRISDNYPFTIKDFDYSRLSEREIAVDDHCYGCTAGQGST
jgi:radical SAM/Cys-rich protein